jgi:hypothetical protein
MPDVALQWHHLPLAAHEPAASAEARLVECAGEAGGHPAFWQAVEWVYAHTRSDGQGLPEGLRYPDLTPAIEQCIASERPDAVIRAQAAEATKQRRDRHAVAAAARSPNRQGDPAAGPIEGDALLSAMDMLAAGDPAATPTSKCLPTSSATCPGSPGLQGYGAVRCADRPRSPRILAANDHRCRGDGCTCSLVPIPIVPGGLALPGRVRPPISPRRFAMSFVTNDSCLESLSPSLPSTRTGSSSKPSPCWSTGSSKPGPASPVPPPCATTCV